MPTLESCFKALAALLLACPFCPPALAAPAQATGVYPTHAVTIVLPFPAGTVTDMVARLVSERLAQSLGQPFVVENRPGGNGSIGAHTVARAPADGYTLLFTTNTTHSIIGSLMKNVPYDPQKDFTPVARIAGLPSMVIVSPRLAVGTIGEFVEYVKKNPGKVRYGYGNSSGQIGGETLKRELGLDMVAVPYKGNPQGVQNLLGGHIEAMVIDVTTGMPFVKSGQLRALAVLMGQRIALLPDVPTLQETVAPGFDVMAWFGAFGPAGMPRGIVGKLAEAIRSALGDNALREKLQENGVEPVYIAPEEFGHFLESEKIRWTELAKNAGLTPQ